MEQKLQTAKKKYIYLLHKQKEKQYQISRYFMHDIKFPSGFQVTIWDTGRESPLLIKLFPPLIQILKTNLSRSKDLDSKEAYVFLTIRTQRGWMRSENFQSFPTPPLEPPVDHHRLSWQKFRNPADAWYFVNVRCIRPPDKCGVKSRDCQLWQNYRRQSFQILRREVKGGTLWFIVPIRNEN